MKLFRTLGQTMNHYVDACDNDSKKTMVISSLTKTTLHLDNFSYFHTVKRTLHLDHFDITIRFSYYDI